MEANQSSIKADPLSSSHPAISTRSALSSSLSSRLAARGGASTAVATSHSTIPSRNAVPQPRPRLTAGCNFIQRAGQQVITIPQQIVSFIAEY